MTSINYMKIFRRRYLMLFILFLPLVMPLLTGEFDLPGKVYVVNKGVPVWQSEVPDFSSISDMEQKKRSFFEFIRPVIDSENEKVMAKRKRLLELYGQYRENIILSIEEKEWLEKLQARYRIRTETGAPAIQWLELIKRVDMLPAELAMTQAAKESGWGTSRFARVGNNIFGQWCFREGCGIVPYNREEGSKHEVRKFGSVNESVRSYIHNLNSHYAYEEFRMLRFEQRRTGRSLDGYSLVSGLPAYSERGDAYLEEIRDMMLANMYMMGS